MTTLPSGDFFQKFYDVADQFITNTFMSNAECTVIYRDNQQCPNCITNTLSNAGTNNFRSGGPSSFSSGICTVCNGTGRKVNEQTDTIQLRVYESQRDWVKVGNVEISEGRVQIIGFMYDADKVRRAEEIHLFTDREELGPHKYELITKLFPHSFGRDRYFVGFLDVVQ